jgi:uncharacterized beta-barrel protein YwiB (DUF1934 family)
MKVKIRIKATVTDLAMAETYKNACVNGFFKAEDGRLLPYEEIASVCEDVMEYTASGVYTREESRVTIRYDEGEALGFSCTTSLIFDETDRDSLTMVRSGEMNAAFRFEKASPRQPCTYETPIMPIEFIVNTRNVRNTVGDEGGAILLDYYLEMRGVNTERNRLLIEVQPL